MPDTAATQSGLADQWALREVLARYCRALDRHEWAALDSIFLPDAAVDYGAYFRGRGAEFPAAVARGLAQFQRHMHSIANGLYAVAGNSAEGETYFTAWAQTPPPDPLHMQFGGRYADRFERRGGQWRIAARTVIHDWLQIVPLSDAAQAAWPELGVLGQSDESDPGYDLLPMLARRFGL